MTTFTQHRMLSRRATAAVVFLVAGFGVLVSLPQAEAAQSHRARSRTFKQQIEQLEQEWRHAQLANDPAAMDKLLSDDYIGISLNGQVNTKAQQLNRIRTRRLMLTRLDFNDMKVKLIGSIAIVTSRVEVEGTNDGISIQGTYRYTRVYKRLPSGAWQITSFEATRIPHSHIASN